MVVVVVVVVVSAACAARDWTRLERRAALNRAVRERREYVLPARFDDTPLPGLLSDMVTVDPRGRASQQFGASEMRGHMAYYAVPGNARAIRAFCDQVTRHSHKALPYRSQKTRINWTRTHRIATRWLPPDRVMPPFPEARFAATHPR